MRLFHGSLILNEVPGVAKWRAFFLKLRNRFSDNQRLIFNN
jgi:hypothetical protein